MRKDPIDGLTRTVHVEHNAYASNVPSSHPFSYVAFSQIIQNRSDYALEESVAVTSLTQSLHSQCSQSKSTKQQQQKRRNKDSFKKHRKNAKKKRKTKNKLKQTKPSKKTIKKRYDPKKIKLLNAIKESLSSTEYQTFYISLRALFEQKGKMRMSEFEEFVLNPFLKLFSDRNRCHFLKDLGMIIPKNLKIRYEEMTKCLQQQYETNDSFKWNGKQLNAMEVEHSDKICVELNDLCDRHSFVLDAAAIADLSRYCPISIEQLKMFQISADKVRLYGVEIVDAIKSYLHQNGLVSPFLQSEAEIDYFAGIEDADFTQIISENEDCLDETGFIQNDELLLRCLQETEEKIKRKKEIQRQIEEKRGDLQQCIEQEMKIKEQKEKIMQNIQNLKHRLNAL